MELNLTTPLRSGYPSQPGHHWAFESSQLEASSPIRVLYTFAESQNGLVQPLLTVGLPQWTHACISFLSIPITIVLIWHRDHWPLSLSLTNLTNQRVLRSIRLAILFLLYCRPSLNGILVANCPSSQMRRALPGCPGWGPMDPIDGSRFWIAFRN